MEYSKKDFKRNIILLYITNALVGFQVGARDLSTTMQVLFKSVGGNDLLSILNQVTYYTLIICLVLVGVIPPAWFGLPQPNHALHREPHLPTLDPKPM